MKDIFITAFNTGLGELVNLRWRNVDLSSMKIYVQNSHSFTTKSKKDRMIPMTKIVKKTIMKRQNGTLDNSGENLVFMKIRGVKK